MVPPRPAVAKPVSVIIPVHRDRQRLSLCPAALVRPFDRFMLFFIHWIGGIVEAQEFLFVRRGWKRPNRS